MPADGDADDSGDGDADADDIGSCGCIEEDTFWSFKAVDSNISATKIFTRDLVNMMTESFTR